MAIRIDEYGHIIRDDAPGSGGSSYSVPGESGAEHLHVPSEASSMSNVNVAQAYTPPVYRSLETSTPWFGSDGVFWTITLALTLGIALLMSTTIAPAVFGTSGGGKDFLESIANFLFSISPYVVFIGTFVGAIWYNAKGTKRSTYYHAGHEYILSPLCAIAGAVGSGLILLLLALAIYVIAAIVVVAIIIAIIAGIFSGG